MYNPIKMLSVEDLGFGYGSDLTIEDIAFDIRGSEVIGIVGPNGSGKTTTMKCLNRILESKVGRILVNGTDVRSMTRMEIARNLAYVPQNAGSNMSMPTVFEVVMMGRAPHGMWNQPTEDDELVWRELERMELIPLANKRFNELSSGQVQRTLIARALVQEAEILLLDEPTSNLDIRYQIEVMNMVRSIVKERGISACAIIHDINLAMRYCDRVLLMDDGRIVDFVQFIVGIEAVGGNRCNSLLIRRASVELGVIELGV